MTEYIVEHIEDALSGKQFPAYKNAFDRFTRIYIESQKVAVPMDILVMSLCECITKNENAIHLNVNTGIHPIEESPIETKEIIEPLSPHPVHEKITTEEKISSPEPKEENDSKGTLITKNRETHNTGVFRDDFIHELSLTGVKPTLIPLLKTADIELQDTVITIKTTIFASKKCQEIDTQSILERVGKMF